MLLPLKKPLPSAVLSVSIQTTRVHVLPSRPSDSVGSYTDVHSSPQQQTPNVLSEGHGLGVEVTLVPTARSLCLHSICRTQVLKRSIASPLQVVFNVKPCSPFEDRPTWNTSHMQYWRFNWKLTCMAPVSTTRIPVPACWFRVTSGLCACNHLPRQCGKKEPNFVCKLNRKINMGQKIGQYSEDLHRQTEIVRFDRMYT